METMSVYWIHHPNHTNIMSEGYVGITRNFKDRMRFHKMLKCNMYLANAIKKYGWDNLVKEVILVSDKDYCIDIEIKLRNTDKIGWNLTKGGGLPPIGKGKFIKGQSSWNKGISPSDATKKKISEAIKIVMQNPARLEINRTARLGKPSPRKGIKVSKETLLKMSLSRKGIPSPKKGVKYTQEQRNNLIQKMRTTYWICPHCNKAGYSIGARNRWHFDNCKSKETI
jgi:predicted GIY-YIG superfamily endonuclease